MNEPGVLFNIIIDLELFELHQFQRLYMCDRYDYELANKTPFRVVDLHDFMTYSEW